MTLGPVQLVVLGFSESALPFEIINQLRQWRDGGTVRLVDVLFVAKNDRGDLIKIRDCRFSSDEAVLLGLLSGAFFEPRAVRVQRSAEIGTLAPDAGEFGLDRNAIDQIADLIPRSSSAVLVLLEHLWAIELKEQVIQANGAVIAQGWITPSTLTANGEDWFEEDLAFTAPN
jgi:uncharacterized membrane protein